jgi:hypothetical protein
MDDQSIQRLLTEVDNRFATARPHGATPTGSTSALVDAVRRRQGRQKRRRRFGALVVVFVVIGLSSWFFNIRFRAGMAQPLNTVAAGDDQTNSRHRTAALQQPTQNQRLSEEEIGRIKGEIAALDSEANRVERFVTLYKAVQTRDENLARFATLAAESHLSHAELSRLEIDRAAAIAVISADNFASQFNRREEAAVSYQSVLRNFPNSEWAVIAKQRLDNAEQMN